MATIESAFDIAPLGEEAAFAPWREIAAKVRAHQDKHGVYTGSGQLVTPPVDPNPSGLTPCGWRVIVLPRTVEEKTKGGIVLPQAVRGNEELAQIDGQVIAIGPDCFNKAEIAHAWCEVGDFVMFGKYKGLTRVGKDGIVYRIINDTDIVCVVDPAVPQQ